MFLYELKLAMRNKLIVFCAIIGIFSGISGIISYYSDTTFIVASGHLEAVSCYQAWLYALSLGAGSLYKIVVPLLIIPNLDSFFVEKKNGYSNFVVSRSSYKKYFFSKLLTGIFVSGAILTFVLVCWLIISMVLFPNNLPIEQYTYISNESLRSLFVKNPLMYIGMIIIANFLFAIIFYSLGFGLSYFCKNRYVVMIIPLLVYLSITMLASILNCAFLSPVSLVVPHDIMGLSIVEIIVKFIIGIFISGIIVLFGFIKSYREV